MATSNHRLPNNTTGTTTRLKKADGSSATCTTSGEIQQQQPGAPGNCGMEEQCKNNFRIGIYGWRKRCLYVLILGLLIIVIINLALTLWVLKVMEFSSEGMGQLKIVAGGVKLEGKAFILDRLIASNIKSRNGQPIVIESSRNLTLSTRDETGALSNRIFLGNDRLDCLAKSFKVLDERGYTLFSANPNEVLIGTEMLKVTGEGGTIFSGSVQTPLLRAESGHDLRLESPTRSLGIRAPGGIKIESRAGEINGVSFRDIKLKSVAGEIRLESGSVKMQNLPTAIPSSRSTQSKSHEVYQLCVCSSGKLFLAHSHAICASAENDNVCR